MSFRKTASGPGISSARRETEARARAEQIARAALDETLKARFHAGEDGASNRAAARHMGISDSYLRDIRAGYRTVALWEVLTLPRTYAEEVLRRCLAEVALLGSGVSPERTHRQLVARLGEISGLLDEALADGSLTADERQRVASQWRQIAARADQAARDLEVA